jgi:hypothetical protein
MQVTPDRATLLAMAEAVQKGALSIRRARLARKSHEPKALARFPGYRCAREAALEEN